MTLKPEPEVVQDVYPLVEKFTNLFQQNLHQKRIKLLISEEYYGDMQAVELLKAKGILLDVEIYK